MFFEGQTFIDEYPVEAADWCNENGRCYIAELDEQDGHRRFAIMAVPEPTEEELAEQAAQEAEAKAEAQRVPDLEDATIELAEYAASLEERIAELEARLNG